MNNPMIDIWYAEAAKPSENAPGPLDVRGVILEVGMDEGLDVLAAFGDGRARYLNHAGNVVIWEGGEGAVSELAAALIESAKPIAENIGVHDGERPPAPPAGSMRISVLTESGLHFGQGPMGAFGSHPMAAPVLDAGVALMGAMVEMR
jgi:hypothetical protein